MTPSELYRWRKARQVVVIGGERQVITAPTVLWMWVGAVTTSSAVVVARVSEATTGRLVVATDPSFTSPIYSAQESSSEGVVKLSITGLSENTRYYYGVEAGGRLSQEVGSFRTLPSGPFASFRCAFSGDASTGSNAPVFDQIVEQAPLFFIHLGDLHYENIDSNDPGRFRTAYDAVLAAPRQARLYREVPTIYVWDDHDFGPDDSDGTFVGKEAATTVYRERVPHYPLEDEEAIYHSFSLGRVLFILTDQRSQSSQKSEADDASKSILGIAQKSWMKSLIQDHHDKLIVWVCSRVFGGVPTAGADHWGGFTTERDELGAFFGEHCPGRICVISADMHSLGIDDGSNHTFGGYAIPTFQAAPLDRTGAKFYGGGSYSEGQFIDNGQFGVMDVTDLGGDEITIDWTGYAADGSKLVTYRFTADLSEAD